MKQRLSRLLPVVSLLGFFMTGCAVPLSESFAEPFRIRYADMAWDSWKREAVGDTGLSVETPTKFYSASRKPPDHIAEFLLAYENHEMRLKKKGADFIVRVHREFYDDRQKVDLEGAVQAARTEFRKQLGGGQPETNYMNEREVSIGTASGHEFSVRLENYGYRYVFLGEGQTFWQIGVEYWMRDPEAVKGAERVIASLRREKEETKK